MLVLLATLALLALAVGIAVRGRPGIPATALVAAVLALPVLLSLPGTLRDEVPAIGDRTSPGDRLARGPGVEALIAAVRQRVPPDGRIRVAAARGEPPLGSRWVRWLAYRAAPRVVVEDEDASWIVGRGIDPGDVGLDDGDVSHFGPFWLAER